MSEAAEKEEATNEPGGETGEEGGGGTEKTPGERERWDGIFSACIMECHGT